MTAIVFKRMCRNLWGPNYHPAASKALKKGVRTLERYTAGKANVPADIRRRLAGLTAIQSEEMAEDAANFLE